MAVMDPCRCGHPGAGCYCFEARLREAEERERAATPEPVPVEVVEKPWTNARLTQRSELTKALLDIQRRYEQDDWSVWCWPDEAEKIMERLGL